MTLVLKMIESAEKSANKSAEKSADFHEMVSMVKITAIGATKGRKYVKTSITTK